MIQKLFHLAYNMVMLKTKFKEELNMIKNITKENFETEVLQSKVPVMLDFFATWCGPCKMLSPTIEMLSRESDSYTVGKVNIDEQPELAIKFGVNAVPTVLVFDGGKCVGQSVGYTSKEELARLIPQR